jgi:single-stranded-DNA-specific exonuclease
MPKTWTTTNNISPSLDFQKEIGGHPLVAHRLSELGFKDYESALSFLDPQYYNPSPPTALPNLSRAVDRIVSAVQNQEYILVWGDFDVDGQTATTLLVQGLRELGATVGYHIPIRATEGHGIHLDVLKRFLGKEPKPKLIITCDTGISEHESITLANSRGVDVIVTDHHELSDNLPNAYSTVSTHLLLNNHPMITLPGVGVAFKLMEEIFNRYPKDKDTQKYLDLVALGIVADVAELIGDTRYLLQKGLEWLRATNRLGLQTLFDISGINPGLINEDQIGFSIGPRLNALGRLSDANPIVEFFTTEDLSRARILANQLEGLNQRRKLLTDQVYQGALAKIEQEPSLLDFAALVLAHRGWPAGIVGIVASRLVDKFGIPTILLNIQDETMAHGSARSIAGVNIKDAITELKDLMINFGGHAGAAGLSLLPQNISEFRNGLSRVIRRITLDQDLDQKLIIDGYVNLSDLSIEFVEDIERLAPFGSGNPPIVLACNDLRLINFSAIGQRKEHLKLVVEDHYGVVQELVWWRGVGESLPPKNQPFDLAFTPSFNVLKGSRKLQLQWVDYRVQDASIPQIDIQKPSIEIVDYRKVPSSELILEEIHSQCGTIVWAEGEGKSMVYGIDRTQLKPVDCLVIWTTPPGYWELQKAIEQVKPAVVYIFSHNPGIDTTQAFLARLTGLVKHVLNVKGGSVNLFELAANLAHREGTVRMGLFWLEAKGLIQINKELSSDDIYQESIRISKGTNEGRIELTEITTELRAMLDETAAFREYFEGSSIESIKMSLSDALG